MPQDMQKKSKSVAALDGDEVIESTTVEKPAAGNADAKYQQALRYLERGMNQQKITDQLVQQGISRPEANELARKVWKENLSTRNQNVTILLGGGAFFVVLGIAFLMPRILNGTLPVFSPAYLMILFGIYLAVRAYFNWREIR